jgi:dihydroneopterin triphosphate diphosphatase
MNAASHKVPISVLVVIHSPDLQVLLLERRQHPGFWQSVTGSQDPGETLAETAAREVKEETGLDTAGLPLADWKKQNIYEIYSVWRHRYAPGVTHNTEHVFELTVPRTTPVILAPEEHAQFLWLPWEEAAKKVFSWSNRDAILELPARLGRESDPI